MLEVGGARVQREKGLAQVTAEAKLITDGHTYYMGQKYVWPAKLRM